MNPEKEQESDLTKGFYAVVESLYERCVEQAPNFGIDHACFLASLEKSTRKFLIEPAKSEVTEEETIGFLNSLRIDELFLALGCANGNERAWWDFDHRHRTYLERVARHLASSELNAQEVVDRVYVELYGTRIVDGQRVSKFANYSGKGSIRGWLRTVIWHSLVDLHRASHDEVSLDEMTENVGEGHAHSNFAETELGGEDQMIDEIARERYRKATVLSIQSAFSDLAPHEKLLLLYYHAENMKLREIARLAEKPQSPLRDWFQRKSATRKENPASRVHESTIMRWLEKTYKTVLTSFSETLRSAHGLDAEEIEICLELATQDLANPDIYKNLAAGL
jgi:RNA polymerase sigma factor (sigma-70 family)